MKRFLVQWRRDNGDRTYRAHNASVDAPTHALAALRSPIGPFIILPGERTDDDDRRHQDCRGGCVFFFASLRSGIAGRVHVVNITPTPAEPDPPGGAIPEGRP